MRWLRKGKLRLPRGQRGISLLEVLIAVAIMAAIGVSLLTALDTNARATRQLDEKVVATNLATAYFEAIKALPYAETYPEPEDLITIPPQYDVNIRTDFSTDAGEIWGEYADNALQKITISISREGEGRSVLSMCTFRADF